MLSSLNNVSVKFRILAYVLIIGIISGLYYYMFYSGKKSEINDLTKQRDNLQIRVSELKNYELSYDNFKKELEILNGQLQMVLEVLPNDKNYNLIYDQLVYLAEKNGVKVMLFQPVGEKKIDDFHYSVDFNMNFEGHYLDFVRYLYSLNSINKIVKINNMTIIPKKDQMGNITLTVSSSMNTYMFNTNTMKAADNNSNQAKATQILDNNSMKGGNNGKK